jgi:hypothetical protein
MKPEKILLPLDIRECPLEIFALVEGFSKRPEVTLILRSDDWAVCRSSGPV